MNKIFAVVTLLTLSFGASGQNGGVRMAGASKSPTTIATCAELAKRIEQLEQMARQPQSAQGQDWIKEEVEKARSKQFALNC